MKKLVMIIVMLCSCIGIAMAYGQACGVKKSSDETGKDRPVYSDPSRPIEIMIGQEFAIELESNKTTGYQWQLAQPLSNSIIELLCDEYQVSKTGLIGAGGKEIWTFKSISSGETIISMKYIRPWEKDVPPVGNVQFRIIVH